MPLPKVNLVVIRSLELKVQYFNNHKQTFINTQKVTFNYNIKVYQRFEQGDHESLSISAELYK